MDWSLFGPFFGMLKGNGSGWRQIVLFWRESDVSDRDRVILTPFNQWRKYRHFPLPIILHFFIVVLVSSQVGDEEVLLAIWIDLG